MSETLVIGGEAGPGQPRRPSTPMIVAAIALLIAVVSLVVAVLSVRSAQRAEQALAELTTAQQRALTSLEAARVEVTDQALTIWIRNSGVQAKTQASLVRVALRRDAAGVAEKPLILTVVPLGVLPACRETRYDVAENYARQWRLSESTPRTPVWILVWTGADGRSWQRTATVSDEEVAGVDQPGGGDLDPLHSLEAAALPTELSLDLAGTRTTSGIVEQQESRTSTVSCG